SLRGGLPPYLPTDQIGPLARSVRDVALVLQAMAQYDPLDPTSVPVPAPDYAAELERGVDGLVVGIPTNHFFDVLDPHVEEAVRKAIGVLEGLGVRVREVTVEGLEHRGVM